MNLVFFRQWRILAADELQQLFFRKRALITFLFYAGTLALTFFLLGQSQELLAKINAELNLPLHERYLLKKSLEHLSVPKQVIDSYPVLGYPLPLLIYFFTSLFMPAFLVPFISCDMISQDLASGTHRFLLFRVSRAAYYWAKAFAHLCLYLLIQGALLVLVLGFSFWYFPLLFSQNFFMQCGESLARLLPILILFVSFTQAVSGQCKGPVKSWMLNQTTLLFLMLVTFWKPSFSFFDPFLWKGLLQSDPATLTASFLGFGAWSAVFWGGGFALFWMKRL